MDLELEVCNGFPVTTEQEFDEDNEHSEEWVEMRLAPHYAPQALLIENGQFPLYNFFLFMTFLDGSTHLYMRVRPSVGRSVGPSVGWMDGWMVRNLFFFLNDDDHNSRNNDRYNDYTDF